MKRLPPIPYEEIPDDLTRWLEAVVDGLNKAGSFDTSKIEKQVARVVTDTNKLAKSMVNLEDAQVLWQKNIEVLPTKDDLADATRTTAYSTKKEVEAKIASAQTSLEKANKKVGDALAKAKTSLAGLRNEVRNGLDHARETLSETSNALQRELQSRTNYTFEQTRSLERRVIRFSDESTRNHEYLQGLVSATQAKFGEVTAKIEETKQTLTTAQQSLASKDAALEAKITGAQAKIATTENALAEAKKTLAKRDTALEAKIGGAEAKIATTETTLADLQLSVAQRETAIEARFDEITATIGRAETALADAEEALAQEKVSTQAKFGEVTAKIEETKQTLTTAQQSLASKDAALEAKIGGAEAKIATTETALADLQSEVASSAVAGSSSETKAKIREVTAKIEETKQTLAETQLTQGRHRNWINHMWLGTGQSHGAKMEAEMQKQKASFASKVQEVSTSVDGVKASVTSLASSINGLKAEYVLKVNAAGHVAGIQLASGEGGSSFNILADRFAILRPGATADEAPKPIFTAGQVEGRDTVVINADTIVKDAGLLGRMISPGAVSDVRYVKVGDTRTPALTLDKGLHIIMVNFPKVLTYVGLRTIWLTFYPDDQSLISTYSSELLTVPNSKAGISSGEARHIGRNEKLLATLVHKMASNHVVYRGTIQFLLSGLLYMGNIPAKGQYYFKAFVSDYRGSAIKSINNFNATILKLKK